MDAQGRDGPIAVVGAGVIGCAVAHALACAGRAVRLIDPEEPGRGGASYGHAGHLATELVQPLPSPELLLGFWRELYALGGALSVPLRRWAAFAPWALRFTRAAFRRAEHTALLTPLVRPGTEDTAELLRAVGRMDLLRRNGHHQVWFGPQSARRRRDEASHMAALGVATGPVPREALAAIGAAAGQDLVEGLWFADTASIVDPLEFCRALVAAACERGAVVERATVRALTPRDGHIEIATDAGSLAAPTVVVCAGAWSSPLLRPFGLRAPLEAARGYHVEMPGAAPLADAPILYVDRHIIVTPMTGRLRASSFMEFGGPDAPPDLRMPARLRTDLRRLGYDCAPDGAHWVGPRPVLPDYMPGLGRAPGAPDLYYAIGHQHLGLTMAATTARAMADLVCGRTPRPDLAPFDLRRFE